MAGIYIHIPYCRQACTYCNFHFSTQLNGLDSMINSILEEIALQKKWMPAIKNIETIYFGGGTPSIIESEYLVKILNRISHVFQVSDDAEITIEVNPDDVSRKNLQAWQNAGFNRLSIGIQSFDERELKWMNRAHSATDALQCLSMIQDSGFTNISADLIFGSHLISNDSLIEHTSILLEKKIPHLSCYALTLEEKTLMDHEVRMKKIQAPDSDKQAEQFYLISDYLSDNGYEQYEISNYALPGMRSRHNSSYWQGKPYIGIGPSAHSFDGDKTRRWNLSNNALYMKLMEEGKIPYEEEILTSAQIVNEYLMTGLRRIEGIELPCLLKKAGEKKYGEILQKMKLKLEQGLLVINNQSFCLSRNGKIMADGIAADLFID